MKKLLLTVCAAALLIMAFIAAINVYMIAVTKPYIYRDASQLPAKYAVIIPGAKVYRDNVSHVVADRIAAAALCLKEGKAQRVLVSGDHGRKDYDEVNQIRLFMHRIYGTSEDIIFMDHAGFSTYETMYRARDIFCVKDAAVVTQKFHTARCVYIARKMGLDAVALEAQEFFPYSARLHAIWEIREALARVKAFFAVLFKIKPTYLGEKIPITGDAKATWD